MQNSIVRSKNAAMLLCAEASSNVNDEGRDNRGSAPSASRLTPGSISPPQCLPKYVLPWIIISLGEQYLMNVKTPRKRSQPASVGIWSSNAEPIYNVSLRMS